MVIWYIIRGGEIELKVSVVKDNEIDEKSNVQKMHFSFSDKPVKIYSLDIILSVGYRVNTAKAINFCKWATKVFGFSKMDIKYLQK